MARGGYGRGAGIPLHQRHNPSQRRSGAARDLSPRHCWVDLGADGGQRTPGLVLDWRRSAAGAWEGRTVYTRPGRVGEWALIEEWLPGELLRPAMPGHEPMATVVQSRR